MPDTDLMDRAVALITAVPELHDQRRVSRQLRVGERKKVELKAALVPESVRAAGCGAAHCIAGWVLVLAGYRYVPDLNPNREGNFYNRDGLGPPLVEVLEAAKVLGIPPREAYDGGAESGLFWNNNTLPMIEAWVAYYKGEIDQVELFSRLEMEKANAGR